MARYKIWCEEVIRWYVELDAKDADEAYELGVNTYIGSSDIPDGVIVQETTEHFETLSIECDEEEESD
jgi:hypothetical protein